MVTKLVHILMAPFVVLLIAAVPASAFQAEVTPRELVPGDIFFLKIDSDTGDSLTAKFHGKEIKLSPGDRGQFIALVPVDVNTSPDTYMVSVTNGEKTESVPLVVKPHSFRTIHLTLPEGKVSLSPENQKRVEKEYILQKKIWDRSTQRAWKGPFLYPLDTEISTEFGVRRIMNKKKTSVHRGMDFRGKTGTPAKALNAGTAVLSRDLFYGGNTLIIDHGMGLYSVYMHLSQIKVDNGAKVVKGQIVGLVGSSGRATGPHLHLSVKLNGVSINPQSLFELEL